MQKTELARPSNDVMITTVNFHITDRCNMHCRHCFAQDLAGRDMELEDAIRLVSMLSKAGFKKINFAGGEPMLYNGLDDLITVAKTHGMITSLVTNSSMIRDGWIKHISASLDILALSIDSCNVKVHRASGRFAGDGPISAERYLSIIKQAQTNGMRTKINTVVTRFNKDEDLTKFVQTARPEKWKIMRVLSIQGQNDDLFDLVKVTQEEFNRFVNRHKKTIGHLTRIVPEDNRLMIGSYAMVNPQGRFIDNTGSVYKYSRPILKVGVAEARKDVNMYHDRFVDRGGMAG